MLIGFGIFVILIPFWALDRAPEDPPMSVGTWTILVVALVSGLLLIAGGSHLVWAG